MERAVILILCDLQSADSTEKPVPLEADTFDFVVSREKAYHIGKLLVSVIYGRKKLFGIRVRPSKDNVINVIEPCERVEERAVFVLALYGLGVAAVVAKAASAKICALNVFHALERRLLPTRARTGHTYS